MSQSRARIDSADLLSPNDGDHTIPANPFEHDSQLLPRVDALSFLSYTEANSAGILPSHRIHSDRDCELEEELGQSLACLELEVNGSFPNGEISGSTFDRDRALDMDADLSQHTPNRTNPMLSLDFVNNPIDGAPTTATPLQNPNATESSVSWQYLVPWSGEFSANLCPPIYTPHRSHAGTHSHYSDSAWETIPSTPNTDDFDIRPMPDDNSASMQDYNHPRTGIWGVQENAYGEHTTSSATRNIPHGHGIISPRIQSLPRNFRQVFDNADAATPFGVYSRPQTVPSPYLIPSRTRGPVPHSDRASFGGQSGISIEISDAIDSEDSSIQRPPEVEQYFDPIGNDQNLLQDRPPRLVLGTSRLPGSSSTSAVFMDPLVPVLTPSTSADTSATAAACPYRGCPASYNGEKKMDTLRRHIRLEHKNRPALVCPVCRLVIKSGRLDNLKRHFQDKHPNTPLPALLNVRKVKSVRNRRHT